MDLDSCVFEFGLFWGEYFVPVIVIQVKKCRLWVVWPYIFEALLEI